MDLKSPIKQFILDVVVEESGQAVADFSDDESLLDAGILDSLGILKLISFLDEEFDMDIPLEDFRLEDFASLDLICKLAEKYR